jgi:hypothetical protein
VLAVVEEEKQIILAQLWLVLAVLAVAVVEVALLRLMVLTEVVV